MQRFPAESLPLLPAHKNHGLLTPGNKYLYTDFREAGGGIRLQIDLREHAAVGRAYYTRRIRDHLAEKTDYHQPDFLHDTQYWCADESLAGESTEAYHKFSLRVQYDWQEKSPELLISYDGISHLFKESLNNLLENEAIDSRLIGKVAYGKRILPFEWLPESGRYHLDKVRAVLNPGIGKVLQIMPPHRIVPDKYSRFYTHARSFTQGYLCSNTFRKIIPHTGCWKAAKAANCFRLPVSGRQLVFGENGKAFDPHEGLKKHGPLRLPEGRHFHYFFMYFEAEREAAQKLYQYVNKKEGFLKLTEYTRLPLQYKRDLNIVIPEGRDPEHFIGECLQQASYANDVVYYAFYLSPWSRFEEDESRRALYYRIKEMLLYRGISMQAVESKKLGANFSYSLANIGIAMIAKLGGIPWRLDLNTGSGLVIGFGAYKARQHQTKYIGSAVCFGREGNFLEFDVFPATDTQYLAGAAVEAFRQYRLKQKDASEIIIHFYKRMSRKELQPIEKMLREIDLDVPVIVAGISQNRRRELLIFDHPQKNCMPMDGTRCKVGKDTYMMNINLRRNDTQKPVKQSMPLRIHLQCNRPGYLEAHGRVDSILQQIYAFSFMHWRSVQQSPVPVSVKYPALIASFLPWFKQKYLPTHGRSKAWFL